MNSPFKVTEGLKPCPNPWCKSLDIVAQQVRGQQAMACYVCGLLGPEKDTEAEAVLAWNTRHEAQLPLLEMLEEAIAAADTGIANCPVVRRGGGMDVCPRCSATASNSCGAQAQANYEAVNHLRKALAQHKDSPDA